MFFVIIGILISQSENPRARTKKSDKYYDSYDEKWSFDLNQQYSSYPVKNFTKGAVFDAHGTENPSTGYTWNVAVDPTNSCGPEGSITYKEGFKTKEEN